jgi:chorismate mutase
MFAMAADDIPPTSGETPSLDLEAIRRGIDEVDRRLVALLAERARLVGQVVHYKRARHMAVVDRAREERMLDRIGGLAEQAGLDARVARQVLRTIIDGFTLLEVEELGPDFGPGHDSPGHDSPGHDSPGHDR